MAVRPAYFDSSTVLKRYVAEPGSSAAERLLRRHGLVSSALLTVEVTSALKRRSGDFEKGGLEATWARFSEDRRRWQLVAVTDGLLLRAENVVRSAGLRTLDAIHLASAIIVGEELGAPLLFVTADAAQAAAAREFGLPVETLV